MLLLSHLNKVFLAGILMNYSVVMEHLSIKNVKSKTDIAQSISKFNSKVPIHYFLTVIPVDFSIIFQDTNLNQKSFP